MIIINGSEGEGGGQILRSSLTLSLITGKPFRIENIRAGRKTPGLLRQHLTAVNAAVQISDGAVEGAALGAGTLTFVPREVRGGDYRFAIGGAGSTMLVLQTLLLPLALNQDASTIVIEGGTHNPSAPPFDFVERAFVPLLKRIGFDLDVQLVRPGFYPAGGGEVAVQTRSPRAMERLDLRPRGEIITKCARAVVSNLPYEIAQREVRVVAEELGWPDDCLQAHTVNGSIGPGNAISVIVGTDDVTDVFTAFGQRGVRAEHVAADAAKQAKRYINSGAAVGDHLADQLLLPLALGAGGSFTTTPLSTHSLTNMDVIRRFLDVEIATEVVSNGVVKVDVKR
jgi:RNA 3'-terminal phosphate cyclase (ATP)